MKNLARLIQKICLHVLLLMVPLCFGQHAAGQFYETWGESKETETQEVVLGCKYKVWPQSPQKFLPIRGPAQVISCIPKLRLMRIFLSPQTMVPSPSTYRNLPMLC